MAKEDNGFLKGYESATPESAITNPNYPYREPGHMAKAVKAHWKNKPEAYPYGTNNDGGV